jgi:hypothetical protein
MSEERKKAAPKPVAKVEPKKRVKPTPKVEPKVVAEVKAKPVEPKIVLDTNDTTEVKVKRAENKYVRIALDAKPEERVEFTSKVKSGELKYAYYATDNDKGYHYYIVLKK